jgi:hypothetical protein
MSPIEITLDQLTEGRDIAAYRDEARTFLSALMAITPPRASGTVIPVARRLLAYPDWRETMTPQSVLDYCTAGPSPRYETVLALAPLRTDSYDPEAEYLCGIVECYRSDIVGRPTFLGLRPDLDEPHALDPKPIDYLAITRRFG